MPEEKVDVSVRSYCQCQKPVPEENINSQYQMSLSSEAGAIAPASKSGYKQRDGSPKGDQVSKQVRYS